VHHGGIGTLSQALAAGIPQLVMPRGFDQPENAATLERLGVGATLSTERYRAPHLAKTLQALVTRAEVADRCRHWAERMRGVDALNAAAHEIERLAQSKGVRGAVVSRAPTATALT
jgi:UDP:flavonoid glycosyltransferase YjiC (YdhE family)